MVAEGDPLYSSLTHIHVGFPRAATLEQRSSS